MQTAASVIRLTSPAWEYAARIRVSPLAFGGAPASRVGVATGHFPLRGLAAMRTPIYALAAIVLGAAVRSNPRGGFAAWKWPMMVAGSLMLAYAFVQQLLVGAFGWMFAGLLLTAGVSFLAFTVGAVIPMAPFIFASGSAALLAAIVASGFALFAVGAAMSVITGRHAVWSGLRMLLIGGAAAAITFGVGRLLHVS